MSQSDGESNMDVSLEEKEVHLDGLTSTRDTQVSLFDLDDLSSQSENVVKEKNPYVKLISSDEHVFFIKREYAMISKTISAMLSGPGESEGDDENEIMLAQIPSHILSKVCHYFLYQTYWTTNNNEYPTKFKISPDTVLELLMASNYLDC
ncbi:hypothetical protein SNEBB_004831 [Seison nebaliae]|nr:hypothetical protein SNEBB_004831 [Seison nebaliae]